MTDSVGSRAGAAATTRLLAELLHELQAVERGAGGPEPAQARLAELAHPDHLQHLPGVLLAVTTEITGALHGVRLSREALQSYSAARLRDSHAKLSEVTAATESAAMAMLNGLDRTLASIDALETARVGETDGAETHRRFDALRAEINELYGCLQFQDIIAQQLAGVGALLVDVERRIATVAELFDGASPAGAGDGAASDPAAYNPDATMRDTVARQALIDEAFARRREHGGAAGTPG